MANNKWMLRAISFLLVFVMVFTVVPPQAFAVEQNAQLYGDVNADGEIDVKDAVVLQKYVLGVETQDIQQKYADVTGDGKIDLKDLLNVKKYLAEWDIVLGPGMVTVSFYDGERLVDQLKTVKGEILGQVPTNEKTSRSNGIFMGWFTDPECTKPFYADAPVTADTKVYGKYSDFDASTLTVTSFAQLDLKPDAVFTVVGKGDLAGITLTPKDGSENVKIKVEGTGPYTVTAVDGFNKGASYELTLPEGLNFVNSEGKTMPDTVRTASFTIAMEAVNNIQMSDAVKYVKHANPAELKEGSTVTISGAAVGDLICFYKTTNPKDRDYTTGNAYMDDPEIWFKVASVSGNKVTLSAMEETDNEKLYEVPDNFPVLGALPTANTGKLTLAADSDGYTLDTEFYIHMVEKAEDATLAYAMTRLSVGDFITIYSSADKVETEGVYYGKITELKDGVITYVTSSAEEIESAADLFIEPVLQGDDLVSQEAKDEIEAIVLSQLADSGFAEEAAYILADLAAKTDGFQNMAGVEFLFTDENGEPLSDEVIALLNLGASFELSDDVELTVEIITSGDQLHFKDKGSVQLAVGVDATFEIEAEDGKVVIDLSAAFVQELALGMSANGSIVKKKILGIPIPTGVKVGASVDVLSFTGVKVDVLGYTVAEEDESLYDQLMEVAKNPEKLGDVLADTGKFGALAEGLKTVGDVFDKIEELEAKIQQINDEVEGALDTAIAYTEDLANLWLMVEEMKTENKLTKDEWAQMADTLGKTNVSQDLMEMLDLSTETELDADRYAEGLNGLLEKYSEMLEKETDWVTLVEKEICTAEVNVLGLCIYFRADFLVRADINIAMGTSFQYEVGKRYNFWFKVGLFKPEAGSSTMDLIDESMRFQFYIMGKIGMKMGIKATAGFAIGSSKFARVGLSLEMGPYVKLYGFFIYEYERWREANASKWTSDQRMAGALYVDIGLYLIVSMDAAALGDLFEVEYTFVDEEFPLYEAGNKKYPYQFHYEPMEGELIVVQDADSDSTNGVMMVLPDEYRAVSYCNLESGYLGAQAFDWDNYHITLSNPAFSIDEKGQIKVEVPADTRYIECDLTLTYKYGKLAFSTYDMQVVIPLVWTNLSLDEISQYFTASVRIGNDTDGYSIVWSKRVRKNEEFTLPSEEEIKELIGYNENLYSSFSYPDAGKKTSIIANTSYDCPVTYTDYALTVDGIENADGTTTSKTFHTTYGNVFDLSALESTGSSIAGTAETAKYTKYVGVTTDATITANGQTYVIDLTQPITGKVAEAIRAGKVKATAVYGDDSVLVTYVFSGIDAPNVTERVRKGTEATYDIYSLVAEYGMAVKDVVPTLGKVNSTTTYYVECGQLQGEKFTLSFEENGGGAVKDIVRVGGSLVGTLPTPKRDGYTFAGWFADKNLKTPLDVRLMPKKNITAYAKWTANTYQVTLNVNGGNAWETGKGTATVTYGKTYGELPVPTRDGHGFQGWFTTQTCDAGTEVKATTAVKITGNQTLYAKWHKLVEIDKTFAYTAPETNPVYSKGAAVEIKPNEGTWPVAPEGAPELKADSFTVKFMRQGESTYIDGYPVNAGTYDVTITRDADNYYAPFSQTITGILTIDKATRTMEMPEILVTGTGFTTMDIQLAAGAIDDLHPKAKLTFSVQRLKADESLDSADYGVTITADSAESVVQVKGLHPNYTYVAKVSVSGDPNYLDATATAYSDLGTTKEAPTDSWKNHMEPIEFVEGVYEYTITTPGQLAYLAYLVNTSTDYVDLSKLDVKYKNIFKIYYATSSGQFAGYTFKLGADLDLSAYSWEPIGRGTSVDKTVDIPMEGSSTPRAVAVTFYQYFSGTFSGNGYTITGMYVDSNIAKEAGENSYENSTGNRGLFGCLSGGRVTNVTLRDSYVYSDSNQTGAIAGWAGNGVLIENCDVEATVYAKKYTGGIVGYVRNCEIRNCVARGSVRGYEVCVGGIVGEVKGVDGNAIEIYNCINYANVHSSSAKHVGGIVGYSEWVNIQSCANYGSIKGTEDVGGIVGYVNDSGHLTYGNAMDCVNYGNVTGSSYHVGGVAGYVVVGRIINSANFGKVRGSNDCVGGITGEHSDNKNAKTINCVNYGNVSSSSSKYIGSVIGRNYDNTGTVAPVYYLAYSGAPKAAGTKNGSSDSVKNVTAYSFKTPDSTLQSNLNGWSGFKNSEATQWTKDDTGYGYIPESIYELLYKEG